MAGARAVIKLSVMNRDIEQDCVDCAAEALTRFTEQRAVAQFMKRELDRKYGSTWHVIVGHSFGSFVTHEERSHLYFFIGNVGFLVWRTVDAAVSPAVALAVKGETGAKQDVVATLSSATTATTAAAVPASRAAE